MFFCCWWYCCFLQDLAGDEEYDESDDESDNGILTMEMLQGLLEAIFLMWTAVAKQLDSVSCIALAEFICLTCVKDRLQQAFLPTLLYPCSKIQ